MAASLDEVATEYDATGQDEPSPGARAPSGNKHAQWRRCLLCIDLQRLCCCEEYGLREHYRRAGIGDEHISDYLRRIQEVVLPNVQALQQYFRAHGHEVIHTRIQSLTRDGRDRSLEHKRLRLLAPPGSNRAEFLPGIGPGDNEVVVNKTASGVFSSTNIEYLLRNLHVSELFVVGVSTNECVSSSVRSAADLGFDVRLISDATAAITPELHEATLLTSRDRYAQVMSTEVALDKLKMADAKTRQR